MRDDRWTITAIVCTALLAGIAAQCLSAPVAVAKTERAAQADYEALKMLRQGAALVENRQEDRGIKLVAAVPLRFPTSGVRFEAGLFLGRYYTEQGDYQLAIKNLTPVSEAEEAEPEQRAEALYRMGICQYELSDYNRALAVLRRVTEDYPWNVSANEAYYYIGLCHFRLNRWKHAVEALKLVGTSVPPNADTQNLVESGQRFFVKIQDKDLRVLQHVGGTLTVEVSAKSGDKETVGMEKFDEEGEVYSGSLKMELGAPAPADSRLQVRGGDVIAVNYVDANAKDGTLQVTRLATSRIVSTARLGFMDGAFREYVQGVFADQNSFLQVKDYDKDTTDQPDKIRVRVYARYQERDEDLGMPAVTEDGLPKYALRDEMTLVLEETGPHTGEFQATIVIESGEEGAQVNKADATLTAVDKDTILLDYEDEVHIGGLDDPRTVTSQAEFLTGHIQDVAIAHREVDTEELRARKNLIEAKFYLRLAEIFADVGLTRRAGDKSDIGLDKVDDVLQRALKASISQDLIEEAYKLKWELLLAKGDLSAAVNACRALMAKFPASTLADVALLQIAKAKMESEQPMDAMTVLRAVLGLKSSDELKAEAQYLIASILDQNAQKGANPDQKRQAMGQAIAAYKECADKFPESPFAGQSLGKVIDFYVDSKNYDRSLEMLQTVFVDFPDAPFLDEMLLKWGLVLAKMKRYEESRDKLQELLNSYPNSKVSGSAQKILQVVQRRIGG